MALTDQLQQKDPVYSNSKPQFINAQQTLVRMPLLLPPRATVLPAISDVLRSISPEQQLYQYKTMALPQTAFLAETTYRLAPRVSPTCSEAFVLPSLPFTTSSFAVTGGAMTLPDLLGARTRRSLNPQATATSRPASRTCKFVDCTQYVVDHGLCVRHGGGKRCIAKGCCSRAKHFGRCWRHGGSVECKAPGCSNRAKSRGCCWSHGGGTKCKTESCDKIAISSGLCWAHGGGKRCIVLGCQKQAYERTCNYCKKHFQQHQQTALRLTQH